MNLLDENIVESQRQELRSRRISTRQVGVDVGWKGMKDGDIIRLLHELNLPTFFTKRMATVIRVSPERIRVWRKATKREEAVDW